MEVLLARIRATLRRSSPPWRCCIAARPDTESLWGPDYGSDDVQYLRVFIKQLRKKLEPDPGSPRYILTEPWLGYHFRNSKSAPAAVS
jgi:DNA-binding response OmpR family regulator